MSAPKHKIGSIVGYDHGLYGRAYSKGGPTALFKITYISTDHGGPGVHRCYGQHCLGGAVGAYEDQVVPAVDADLEIWGNNSKYRKDLPSEFHHNEDML